MSIIENFVAIIIRTSSIMQILPVHTFLPVATVTASDKDVNDSSLLYDFPTVSPTPLKMSK